MAVILDDNFRMLVLDHLCQLAEECWLADARHILQADFLCASGNHLVGDVHVVFQSVNRRVGDAKSALWSHSALLSPLDAGDDIAHIVQSVEDTCDVGALLGLYLIHKGAHVVGHRIHAQRIKTSVEHVGLDASLVERLAEGAHSVVRILASEKVDLLEGSAVGFYAGKATHLNDNGSNALQLVFAWLELAGRLPHISVNETELDFLFHLY